MRADGSRIPLEVFRPILVNYIKAYETLGDEAPVEERTLMFSPLRALSFQSGVGFGQLENWLYRNRPKTVAFDDVDRMLCAMNLVHLWWTDPLCEFYYAESITDRFPLLPLDENGGRCCLRCGEWFLVDTSTQTTARKKFCSLSCRKRKGAAMFVERRREGVYAYA